MAKEAIVTEARILPPDREKDRYGNEMQVRLNGGEWKRIFEYYPNELTFSTSEFIGKTEEECYEIRHNRDVAYIQS